MKKFYLVALALILLTSMILVSCGEPEPEPTTTKPTTSQPTTSEPTPTPTSGGPVYGGTLILARNTGINEVGAPMDLAGGWGGVTYPLWCGVTETLFIVDAASRIVPQLAESVDVAPDGLSITLKLVKGVQFHDGTDFNAEAVKINLETTVANNVPGSAPLQSIESYDIIDDHTIRINLKGFDATTLMCMAQSGVAVMISPAALAKPTTPENAGKDHLVGTGPFLFDSWAQDQFIRVVRNPNYWQEGRPYLDGYEIRNMNDLTTSVMAFKAGEVDQVENIDPAQYNQLKEEGYAVDIPPGLAFVFSLRLSSANPESPFSKKEVREAVWHAIDKEGLVYGLGKGTYNVAEQLGSPYQGWYIEDYPHREYNVEKAKQLLADAGYPNGFQTVLHGDVQGRQDDLVAIQAYLAAVGIECELDIADMGRVAIIRQEGWEGVLQTGFPNWSSFSSWMNLWINPAGLNYPSIKFPDNWEESWVDVKTEPDYDKRMDKMKALYKYIYDEALMIPWMYDSPRYVLNSKVHDMKWDAVDINGYWDPVNCWKEK